MTSLDRDQVFTGFWVDYTHGSLLGATITMSSNSANVVVAVLSLLVGFAGSHLWDLIAYLMFTILTPEPNQRVSVVTHQKRFLLRNVSSPGTIALLFANMCWSWRKSVPHSRLSLSSTAVLAGLCSMIFLAGGILSSLVVSTSGIDVLVESPTCGFVTYDFDQVSTTELGLWAAYGATQVRQSLSYSRTCYNGSSSNPQCQVYPTKSIPFTTQYSQCPFSENVCTNQAISMETGLLDSAEVFGINAKHEDRIKIRRRITCAPINGSASAEVFSVSTELAERLFSRPAFPNEEGIRYTWGQSLTSTHDWNYTLTRSLVDVKTGIAYQTYAAYYYPLSKIKTSSLSSFKPGPELLREDANIVLLAVTANSIRYDGPIDDPVFAAHRVETGLYSTTGDNRTYYLADSPDNWIGCIDQQQYCLPSGACTELTSSNHNLEQALSLGMSPRQNVTHYNFWTATHDLSNVGHQARTPPLPASEQMNPNLQVSLPSNQWEIEVKAWMAWLLAATQKTISDVSTGPGATGQVFESIPTNKSGLSEHWLCHAQKMKGPNGISNVSVFGLSFIIAVSGLIITANALSINIMKWLSRSGRVQSTTMKQWDREALLQTQRRTFELQGQGQWLGGIGEVPVTAVNDAWPYNHATIQHGSQIMLSATHTMNTCQISATPSTTQTPSLTASLTPPVPTGSTAGSSGASGSLGSRTQVSSNASELRAPTRVKTM